MTLLLSLGITPQNVFQTLFHGVTKQIPLAKVNEQPLGVASCGFDTYVNQIANRFPTIFRELVVYRGQFFLLALHTERPL